MMILKSGFRLSIGIQHRVFSIPLVKRHSVPRILCSEQRDYSSSGIFKYVPKKSHGDKSKSQPVDVSDKGRLDNSVNGNNSGVRDSTLEKNDAGGSYMNESCDDFKEDVMRLKDKNDSGMYMNVSCDDDSIEELEDKSKDVSSKGYKKTRQHKRTYDELKLYIEGEKGMGREEACKTMQDAENMAIRWLGNRAYSAVELKKKLVGKRYPLEIVNKVVTNFQLKGFINDNLYAESFSRSRWSSLSWGPRRIKQALFNKGISKEDSDAAIKLVFEEGQENQEPESKHGMSKEAMDLLYVQASKRWLQGRDLPRETRKARVIRWFQYRGFNWGVVGHLIKRLESHES